MVQLHPQQQFYFNFLVDRTTPEYLRTQYAMDYWRVSLAGDLKYLLERHPEEPVYLSSLPWACGFPAAGRRQRLALSSEIRDPDYVVLRRLTWNISPTCPLTGSATGKSTTTPSALLKEWIPPIWMRRQRTLIERFTGRPSRESPLSGANTMFISGTELWSLAARICPAGDLSGRFVAKVFPIDPENTPGFNPGRRGVP